MQSDTFGRKVAACLLILAFGLVVLVMESPANGSDFTREMDTFAARGKRVTARQVSRTEHRDGLGRRYDVYTFAYEADGRPFTYEHVSYPQWDEHPPTSSWELTYLPEDPGHPRPGVSRHEDQRRIGLLTAVGFLIVGAVSLAVTVLRRDVYSRQAAAIEQVAATPAPDQVDRTFDYRQPVNLILPLVILAFVVPMAAFGFLAAAHGQVKVDGVPGDGRFQLVPALVITIPSAVFGVYALATLLSFFNERIVWKDGWVSWIDRFGRLRLSVPLTEIQDVFREDTWFVQRGVEVDGVALSRRRIERVVIATGAGRIKFLGTTSWAPVLEGWAETVARRNRYRPRVDWVSPNS